MIQGIDEIEKWYDKNDPWDYENNVHDLRRKEILLTELSGYSFDNVLDIGCGQGFITKDLPGKRLCGVDISIKAINQARINVKRENASFIAGDLFELNKIFKNETFDLIIITGVLYKQYIGRSNPLIYLIIDKLLKQGGLLISVHIYDWYNSKFPYLLVDSFSYDYRDYNHKFEKYIK